MLVRRFFCFWILLLAVGLFPGHLSAQGKLVLVCGNGKGGDGGPANQAKLLTPYGVGFDGAGNMYIGEIYGHKVRKIDPQGIITTVAGTGEKGYGGDGGPALKAKFHEIHDLVVAANGDIYTADSFNYRIRKIDGKTGIISLIAGTGKREATGDGGPGQQASLDGTASLCLNATQDKLYSTGFSKRVRVIDLKTGIIDTVPGIPGGRSVAVDSKDRIYVGVKDTIHVLEPGQKSYRNLFEDNPPSPPLFAVAMCVDGEDNLYIAEMKSQTIRRYSPKTRELTILVGCGKRGRNGLNGPLLEAELADPHGINVRPGGVLVFADSFNYRVVRAEPK